MINDVDWARFHMSRPSIEIVEGVVQKHTSVSVREWWWERNQLLPVDQRLFMGKLSQFSCNTTLQSFVSLTFPTLFTQFFEDVRHPVKNRRSQFAKTILNLNP
jgi:hypothetical protein